MSDRERKSMVTAALLLCGAALIRFLVVGAGPAPAPLEGRPSIADSLLAAGDSVVEEKARRSKPLAPGERIDPNAAGEEDLDRLPGVGKATAARIVQEREENGAFASVDELARVKGIGPAAVERMRPFLRVGSTAGQRLGARPAGQRIGGRSAGQRNGGRPASVREGIVRPIDVNRASAAELVALPGVGPVTARRIVAFRQEQGRFARAEDLTKVPGIGPKTFARIAALVTVRE